MENTLKRSWYQCSRAIVVNNKGEVLTVTREMVDEKTQKPMRLIQVPGGGMAYQESPYMCVIRELSEELGVDIPSLLANFDVVHHENKGGSTIHCGSGDKLNVFQDTYIRKYHGYGPTDKYWFHNTINWFVFEVRNPSLKFEIGSTEKDKFSSLQWVKPTLTDFEELGAKLDAHISSEILNVFARLYQEAPFMNVLKGLGRDSKLTHEVVPISLSDTEITISYSPDTFLATTSKYPDWSMNLRSNCPEHFPPEYIGPSINLWVGDTKDAEEILEYAKNMPNRIKNKRFQTTGTYRTYYMRVYKEGDITILSIRRERNI